MFETYESLPEPTTKAFAPNNWDGKPKREIETRWVLCGGDGVPEVVVDLTSSHSADSKSFSATVTWGTVDSRDGFKVYSWASDHTMLGVLRSSVERYSKKVLEAFHAEALERFVDTYEAYGYRVFAEAVEVNALGQEVPA